MSESTDILFELINIRLEQDEFYSMQGTVTAISEANRTCTVTPSDGGPDIQDVRLEADYELDTTSDPKGFFVVPTLNSLVIITFMNVDDAFISAWSSISKVISIQDNWIFNDGTNEGLINIIGLTTKLNDLVTKVNDLYSLLQTWTVAPNDGGLALKTAALLLTGAANFDKDDYEDTNITH